MSSYSIRLIEKSEFMKAHSVWEQCFPEDMGAFCDYYFKYRTKPENILGAFDEDGVMVSALHILMQTLIIGEKPVSCGFIAGMGTVKEHRHEGIGLELMKEAIGIMRTRGCSLSVLQPSVHGFYELLGYKPLAYRNAYTAHPGELSTVNRCSLHTPDAGEMLAVYKRFCAGYDAMLLRDRAFFDLLIEEQNACGGLVIASDDAYALCTIEPGGLEVVELAGENTTELIASLVRDHGTVRFYLPTDVKCAFTKTGVQVFNLVLMLNGSALELSKPAYSFEFY